MQSAVTFVSLWLEPASDKHSHVANHAKAAREARPDEWGLTNAGLGLVLALECSEASEYQGQAVSCLQHNRRPV